MTRKEKGRNRSSATLKQFDNDDCTGRDDPLTGWINPGKQSRINRCPKRTGKGGSDDF